VVIKKLYTPKGEWRGSVYPEIAIGTHIIDRFEAIALLNG